MSISLSGVLVGDIVDVTLGESLQGRQSDVGVLGMLKLKRLRFCFEYLVELAFFCGKCVISVGSIFRANL